jgi:hypothetical protein
MQNKKGMNKKAQDISITTIILVVLGIAILIFLIIGSNRGWEQVLPWLSSNTVDSVKAQCQASCAQQKTDEFCNSPKTIKSEVRTVAGASCYYISEKLTTDYGLAKCPQITCTPEKIYVESKDGKLDCTDRTAKDVVYGVVENKFVSAIC